MKVKIGPYKNWVGPYQIIEKIFFWIDTYTEDGEYNPKHKKVRAFGKWLSEDKNGNDSYLTKICNYIYSKQKRTINVRIDNYDVWNADSTLAYIILPTLKKLKDTKHGSAHVDLDDVPKELQYTTIEDFGYQPSFDFYNDMSDTQKIECDVHTRWDWVLGEMIFAFEHIINDNWEDEFNVPCEQYEMLGDTYNTKPDWNEIRKVEQRIQNGLNLFGKYYQALWS